MLLCITIETIHQLLDSFLKDIHNHDTWLVKRHGSRCVTNENTALTFSHKVFVSFPVLMLQR